MTITELKMLIDSWIKDKFTGIITLYFHQGGIRSVKKEEEVK